MGAILAIPNTTSSASRSPSLMSIASRAPRRLAHVGGDRPIEILDRPEVGQLHDARHELRDEDAHDRIGWHLRQLRRFAGQDDVDLIAEQRGTRRDVERLDSTPAATIAASPVIAPSAVR